MDVLREREVKDSLERQLLDEQKIRALVQKRLRRERRIRKRLQDQLDLESQRRHQLEEALKSAGASDQVRIISENLVQPSEQKSSNQKVSTTSTSTSASQSIPTERERVPGDRVDPRMDRDRVESPAVAAYGQHGSREPPPPPPPETKPWGYAGIDLMNTGAAFWQNYSESLAQELELERKSRQQQAERDVKSPLQDRAAYYKNSVLFTSTAT